MGCIVYPCEGISMHVYVADFVRGAGKDGTGRVWCPRGTSQRTWVCVLKFFQAQLCAACKIKNSHFAASRIFVFDLLCRICVCVASLSLSGWLGEFALCFRID